jgi:hypothetical protein
MLAPGGTTVAAVDAVGVALPLPLPLAEGPAPVETLGTTLPATVAVAVAVVLLDGHPVPTHGANVAETFMSVVTGSAAVSCTVTARYTGTLASSSRDKPEPRELKGQAEAGDTLSLPA